MAELSEETVQQLTATLAQVQTALRTQNSNSNSSVNYAATLQEFEKVEEAYLILTNKKSPSPTQNNSVPINNAPSKKNTVNLITLATITIIIIIAITIINSIFT